MPKPSRLALAKDDIISLFSNAPQKVYSKTQLSAVLQRNRHIWHLTENTTTADLISFLKKQGDLRARKLRSKNYGQEINRYSWATVSPYELGLSIKSHAYLCHATALALHELAKPNSKMIYLNSEQSPKSFPSGPVTQDGINRAFSRDQRQSNLIYVSGTVSIIMISGKNTKRLGVVEMKGPNSETLAVTNLERTLIDVVVRPTYAGGVSRLIEAYHAARERVSVDQLLVILQELDYAYPYHQAIGFLMQKTGYPETHCAKLQELGLKYDFYLDHGMQQPNYSAEWRLYYPKGLAAVTQA